VTKLLGGQELAARLAERFPNVTFDTAEQYVAVPPAEIEPVARFLRDDPQLDFKFLISVTAVDRLDYFEVVYHLQSISKNHAAVIKALTTDHDMPVAPSVVPVWQGAHLQEREVYDLMGIRFEGHPDMRRIFLWDGFPGHPLRKDFLSLPSGLQPGLQQFPRESVPEQSQ
jgi:NADH-quinone oxidoreductase subunit C